MGELENNITAEHRAPILQEFTISQLESKRQGRVYSKWIGKSNYNGQIKKKKILLALNQYSRDQKEGVGEERRGRERVTGI